MPNMLNRATVMPKYEITEAEESELSRLYLAVKRRWRGMMVVSLVVPMVVMGVLETLPGQYTSKATLVLMQAQIPKQYVDQVAIGSSAEMINAVSRQVLSVTRLSGIVEKFGLFPKRRGVLNGEQLGEELRKRIEVHPVDQLNPKADYTAFSISFTDSDPKVAQKVLSQLATLFVEVNLRDREAQAQSTTQFLKGQLEISKNRLEEQERILMNARVANASQNPTINAAKLSVQSDLRIQLQMNAANLSRLQQRRISIEASMMAGIAKLEEERAVLLTTYTAQHPEVRKKTAEIEAVRSAMRGDPSAPIAASFFAEMKAQLDGTAGEIIALESDAKVLRKELAKYNATILQSSPVTEQELSLAQKDYDLIRQEYADLQTKFFRSQVSANLEEEQSGQNFKLVDPPTLPALPSSPKRLRISLVGLLAGVLLGILWSAAPEVMHPTYLTNKELSTRHPSLLLINIPIMVSPREEGLRRIKTIGHLIAGLVGAIMVVLWVYRMYLMDSK